MLMGHVEFNRLTHQTISQEAIYLPPNKVLNWLICLKFGLNARLNDHFQWNRSWNWIVVHNRNVFQIAWQTMHMVGKQHCDRQVNDIWHLFALCLCVRIRAVAYMCVAMYTSYSLIEMRKKTVRGFEKKFRRIFHFWFWIKFYNFLFFFWWKACFLRRFLQTMNCYLPIALTKRISTVDNPHAKQ